MRDVLGKAMSHEMDGRDILDEPRGGRASDGPLDEANDPRDREERQTRHGDAPRDEHERRTRQGNEPRYMGVSDEPLGEATNDETASPMDRLVRRISPTHKNLNKKDVLGGATSHETGESLIDHSAR